MKILVTGSAGHLGEALMRSLPNHGYQPVGIDIKASDFTTFVGSLTDRALVSQAMNNIDAVIHTATLHKPHVATHTRQEFIDTNVTGTLNLLEEAAQGNASAFIYTSTTSAFGDAMTLAPDQSAVWVTEELVAKHKNIYGVTKTAAENLCELFSNKLNLPCLVLRTSRFFPEEDDNASQRSRYGDDNLKVNELLFRRADIADIVDAHVLALQKAPSLEFNRFIISATTPFQPGDTTALAHSAADVVAHYHPRYKSVFNARGWDMFPTIGRVYDNTKARTLLGWKPVHTFGHAIDQLELGKHYKSQLAIDIGSKGYHNVVFEDGPYPVDS